MGKASQTMGGRFALRKPQAFLQRDRLLDQEDEIEPDDSVNGRIFKARASTAPKPQVWIFARRPYRGAERSQELRACTEAWSQFLPTAQVTR